MDRYWERFVVYIDEESAIGLDSVLEIIATCRNGEIRTLVESYHGGSLIYCESPVCGTGEFTKELNRREIQYEYSPKEEAVGMYCAYVISDD